MRRPAACLARLTLLALAGAGIAPAPTLALERTVARAVDQGSHESWSRSTTGTIRYYNNCTGWVWVWNTSAGDRMGQVFDSQISGSVAVTWSLTFSGVPCGYGFTGTIALHRVDGSDVPLDPPVTTQPYCIPPAAGWQATAWGGVYTPSRFAVVITAPTAAVSFGSLATDHPAGGPTGPSACGTCYPSDRVTHSYYWGTATSPLTPGDRFFDGFCDAELMMDVNVKIVTEVESRSWGQIKSLYR